MITLMTDSMLCPIEIRVQWRA